MVDQAEDLRKMMKEMNGSDAVKGYGGHRKTRVITVSSGKGGVGKTNLAINLGIAYAQLGKRVVVMDADLGLANVNVCLGIIPKYNLFHLIKKQKTMKDIIIDTKYGIQIVAGASGFSKIANLTDAERDVFISELDTLSYADVLIIDTGAGVGQNVLSFVIASDEVIIVTTPEPTAITDAYGIIKIIATEINNPALELKLIVNRATSVIEGRKVAERVINIANQFLNVKVDNLGIIYEDIIIPQSVRKQMPFIINDPKAKASQCVKHIVSRLEGVEFKEGGGLKNFLAKMMGTK
ncbi:MAG: MinD/ParA family protein [Spirochaetales bacterium]|nr:MinD/ParA family protein [Spirochaetales bacterium]MBR6200560.1 MinD/ParA family protein [Spirochaetales bacterium]